jgi:methyl-accepting chemotaxis protein
MFETILFVGVVMGVAGVIVLVTFIAANHSVLKYILLTMSVSCVLCALVSYLTGKYGMRHLLWGVPLVLVWITYSYFINRNLVVKPLKRTHGMLEELAEGEGNLTIRLEHQNKDEIGFLSGSFDSFMDFLSTMVLSIKKNTHSLTDSFNKFTGTVNESSFMVSLVTQVIQDNGRGMEEQSATVEQTVERVRDIAKQAEGLRFAVESQTVQTEQSSAAIEEMISSINSIGKNLQTMTNKFNSLVDDARQGEEKQGQLTVMINDLIDESDKMQNANKVISSIAAQTNLLAMNAAIEAAHAGESGRGFAVVADEIRKLAESSARQSGEISRSVDSIVGNLNQAGGFAGETEGTLRDISSSMERLNQAVMEINGALEEQMIGSRQTQEALGLMSSSINEIKVQSQTISGNTEEVLNDMKSVEGTARRLYDSSMEAVESMEQIKSGFVSLNHNTQENGQVVKELVALSGKFIV